MYAYIKTELVSKAHDDSHAQLEAGGAMQRIALPRAVELFYAGHSIYMECETGSIVAKPFALPRADLVWWYPEGEPMRFAPAKVMLVPQLETGPFEEEVGVEADYEWIRGGC